MHNAANPPADERHTLVHITHWKAGSQWIYHILHECCAQRIAPPEPDCAHFLKGPVHPGKIYPTVYLSKHVVDKISVPGDTRFFVVLRDPRDTLVSLYYSHKISHRIEGHFTADLRQKLQTLHKDDGLISLIAGNVMQEIFSIHTSWINAGAPVFHYESLISHDEELLVSLFTRICPLGVPEAVIRAAIQRNRFDAITGRALGVEDVQSHLRSGQPGEWRKHFSHSVAEAFEARFGDQLRALNYVQDASWIREAEARPKTDPIIPPARSGLRDFSVILTLPQHRGHAIEAVQSWTRRQTYPDQNSELIVVSDGASPALDNEITRHFRPADRILVVPGANRSVLLNRGVAAATCGQLVFAEAHAEAEPDFLKELDAWLSTHPHIDAVCCRTLATFKNNFAYWDGRLYDEVFTVQRVGNAWWNINIHAFSMTRDCFHQAGPLDEDYDLFSLMLLASKLRGLARQIAYAAAPAVLHHYRPNLGEVEQQIRSFVRDEYRFRQKNPGPDRLGFTSLPAMPRSIGPSDPWPQLLRSICKNRKSASINLCIRLLWRAVLNLAPLTLWSRTGTARQLARSKLHCLLWQWDRTRLEAHYRNFRSLIATDELQILTTALPVKTVRALHLKPGEPLPMVGTGAAVTGLHGD
ncbi:MAG TPA: glycosyltransferase family A protein, partial [Roseimicrobium sp.]|nr:glycosyltransferase family A protein [Roseimicrobium sp.]